MGLRTRKGGAVQLNRKRVPTFAVPTTRPRKEHTAGRLVVGVWFATPRVKTTALAAIRAACRVANDIGSKNQRGYVPQMMTKILQSQLLVSEIASARSCCMMFSCVPMLELGIHSATRMPCAPACSEVEEIGLHFEIRRMCRPRNREWKPGPNTGSVWRDDETRVALIEHRHR